jgi:hypothetical protein
MPNNDRTFKHLILGLLLCSGLWLFYVASDELRKGETHLRMRHYEISFDSSKDSGNFEQFVYLKFGVGFLMVACAAYVGVKWKV